MSDSVRPHRRQPTRLPHSWDSPSKNTGVGCHCLLQCMKVKSESEVAQSCPTPSDPMDCSPPGSSVHGICQARVLEWGAIAFSRWVKFPNLHCNNTFKARKHNLLLFLQRESSKVVIPGYLTAYSLKVIIALSIKNWYWIDWPNALMWYIKIEFNGQNTALSIIHIHFKPTYW